jgi:hypothetical protein
LYGITALDLNPAQDTMSLLLPALSAVAAILLAIFLTAKPACDNFIGLEPRR